jgi:hypothetical protein
MKLHIVFNNEGEILAAVKLDSAPVRVRPVADEQEGHKAAEVYVPREHRHYDLAGVCQRLTVDVSGQFPELKAKS